MIFKKKRADTYFRAILISEIGKSMRHVGFMQRFQGKKYEEIYLNYISISIIHEYQFR